MNEEFRRIFTSSAMLDAGVVIVPDRPPPLFAYGLHNLAAMARVFEPYIATGMSDLEAWDALYTEAQRIALFKASYGNRKGKARRKAPTLFEVAS